MSQSEHPATLRLSLLGPPQLERDGAEVHIGTRKAMALLAFLAVSGQVHSREALATLLWPEHNQTRAYGNLRRTLWILNRTVGQEYLDVDPKVASLRRETGFWLDVGAFRDHLAECQTHDHAESEICSACLPPLTAAVDVYHDDFMAGFTLPDSPDFDEWQYFEREGLRSELAGALERLVRCHAGQQSFGSAITFARRWLAMDPLDEPARRALMRLYAWGGQRAAALHQYQECVRILDQELGAPPEEETTQLYQAIRTRQLAPPVGDTVPVAGTVPGAGVSLQPEPSHNLPPQPTPFVGREAELAEIARLFRDPDCRLLTLTGPGGAGKTRLALEAAAAQLDHAPASYPHGVHFVPLAPVSGPKFIVPTIAGVLGFSFYQREGSDARRQLSDYLCEKQMLLLLDNLEHLVGGAGLLSEILEQAPGVRLLVTSRERLNLQGEWVLQVPGMRYPEEGPVESLEEYGAVQLFLRRARQVDAGFSPSGMQIPDLVRICQLVDGMPLGIELAAAWVRMLSCREIVDHLSGELGGGLDLLTTPMRDIPERHRSLRVVFDHSWALLSEEEKDAFKRLAVFRGGFQREAAEQVAGASLPLLSALVDKSLVHRAPDARYQVHPILLQYAAEKLAGVPQEEAAAHDRHSAHFMAFLQQREAVLKGADQIMALEEIEAEMQNVRAAWRWAIARASVAEIGKAAPGLWLFYEMRSLFEEGEEAFRQVVAKLDTQAGQVAGQRDEADRVLGMALAFQGRFCSRRFCLEEGTELLRRGVATLRRLGAQEELGLALSFSFQLGVAENAAQAEKLLHETLAIHEKLERRWEIAFALLQFGYSVFVSWPGQVDPLPYLQWSHALSSELGDRWGTASCLQHLGECLHYSGDLLEARQHMQESLVVLREIGDRQAVQYCLDQIGVVARESGEYEEARRLHWQSIEIATEVGDGLGVAGSLDNLGMVAYDVGDYDGAEWYFREGLAIRRQLERRWETGLSLHHLGDVAMARGDYGQALQYYQDSLEPAEEFDWLQANAMWRLGEAVLALGELPRARQHLRAALELASQIGMAPQTPEGVLDMVPLTGKVGETESAAELAAFVASHPDTPEPVQERAEALLDDLAARLPPEAIGAARERSKGKTLGEVVQEVVQALAT